MLRRIFPWLGAAALVIAAVVTAGWGDGAPVPQTPRPSTPTPTSRPAPSPTSLSASEAQSLVHNAVLMGDDLPDDFISAPGRLSGYLLRVPSLRLCGSSFGSEDFRLATHRVAFRSRAGEGQVENVVIAYEHGYAGQALAELEAAAPRCTSPVRPGPQEQPDTLVLRVRDKGSHGQVRHDLVVERRGDVLSLLRVDGRQGYLTLDLARRLGNRLESLLP